VVLSDLGRFLQRAAATPFCWGTFDCGLWLADWCMVARPEIDDPAAHLRGAYSDARGAHTLMPQGGFAALVSGIAGAAGLRPTSDYEPGTIALVRPATRRRLTGSIRGRHGWVLLTPVAPGNRGITSAADRNIAVDQAWGI
jgi:hypothetical protein